MMPELNFLHSFKRKHLIWIIGAVLLFLLVIWTVLWIFLSSKTSEIADQMLEELAGNGIQFICSERNNSGFPFSIKVNCLSPKIEQVGGANNIKGERLTASTGIFSTGTYLVEVEGPVYIQSNSFEAEEAIFNWDLAQLKIGTDHGSVNDLMVIFDSVTGNFAKDAPSSELQFDQFALNLLSQIDESNAGINLTLNVEGLNLNDFDYSINQADVDLFLVMPMSESQSDGGIFRLGNHFMKNGGNIHVRQVRLDTMGVETEIGGDLDLPPNGLLSGKVSVWISGVEKLMSLVDRYAPNEVRQNAAIIPNILSIIPKNERNGKSGIEIPITIKNGKVQAGFVPLGTIPPLL